MRKVRRSAKSLSESGARWRRTWLLNSNDEIDYFLTDNDVVKTLPYCITAMAFLPRADRVAVACGDKEGHVAL